MSRRASGGSGDTTHFGFREVGYDEKTGLVRQVFDTVADRYDLMNDLMSGGVHRLWKAALIDWLRPRAGMHLLDVAGGTGDIAFRAYDAGCGRVTVCDLTERMVRVGHDRAIDRGVVAGVDWLVGDAEALPVAAASVAAYTVPFGLRTVPRLDAALPESTAEGRVGKEWGRTRRTRG